MQVFVIVGVDEFHSDFQQALTFDGPAVTVEQISEHPAVAAALNQIGPSSTWEVLLVGARGEAISGGRQWGVADWSGLVIGEEESLSIPVWFLSVPALPADSGEPREWSQEEEERFHASGVPPHEVL